MILIMDNFGAHINPEVLQLLVDNHVIIVPLPPHARVHFLQPLDVVIMQVLKHCKDKATKAFGRLHKKMLIKVRKAQLQLAKDGKHLRMAVTKATKALKSAMAALVDNDKKADNILKSAIARAAKAEEHLRQAVGATGTCYLTRKKPVDALAKDATACSKAMESATVCWASCLPLEAAVIATSAHVISAWQIAAAMAPAHGTNLAGTGDGSATGGLPPP
mmetsp:Transcript_11720/g.29505  ORF Transcript_11720/g.29505 Transcript_11720/m.29505 type:complete len:219 (-) Transcript_11720:116-772(-)